MPQTCVRVAHRKGNVKTLGSIMLTNTSNLTGTALDWAVAKALNRLNNIVIPNPRPMTSAIDIGLDGKNLKTFHSISKGYIVYSPSTKWKQGGPIIAAHNIWLTHNSASKQHGAHLGDDTFFQKGDTPLVAAMRCFVQSKLGNTVDIPTELL